jgi:threonine dehydrogenase-like Zn-dependent dehydrogenase
MRSRAISEPGRRQDQDVVIDCTGSSAGLKLALQFVRPRGIVLLKSPGAGVPFPPGQAPPAPPPPAAGDGCPAWAEGVDLTPAVVNEVHIMGCRDASIADGLGVLTDLPVDVASLVSKRLKLDDAPAAFAAAANPENLAVLMDV